MAKGPNYLKRKLACKRARVETRYRYYDMKESHVNRNLFVPSEMLYKFSPKLGWCTKAVNALADRLQLRGFSHDNFDMMGIYQMNNMDVLCDSAILGALISSCDFIYISSDADGFPRLQVIDGGNATGIMDEITGMLTEGYAVLERDDKGNPLTELYFEPFRTTIYKKDMEPYVVEHAAPYPLLVPIVYRPDAKRPFGHSRISRSCMKYQDNTADTLVNMYICSEVYAFPQKYLLGTSPDMEMSQERARMSSFLRLDKDEDGDKPSVGQFNQSSMTPYLDEIKVQASLFAGETGLTIDDLGFTQSNPSSAESIKASHESLRLEARKAQRSFGIGFLNAGYLGACLRDGIPYKRNQVYMTKPTWEPIFEPDAGAIGAIGDAAIKINQAVPGYFNEENLRELTGLDGGNNEY